MNDWTDKVKRKQQKSNVQTVLPTCWCKNHAILNIPSCTTEFIPLLDSCFITRNSVCFPYVASFSTCDVFITATIRPNQGVIQGNCFYLWLKEVLGPKRDEPRSGVTWLCKHFTWCVPTARYLRASLTVTNSILWPASQLRCGEGGDATSREPPCPF
jgi:hypothetical protein